MAYGDAQKTRSTAVWIAVFFAAAFALRIVFSLGVGFDDSAGRHIFTGNDPYYHDRALRHLMDTGETLTHDDAINYPDGRTNPNPPLFVWSAAPLAWILEASGSEDPTGLALNLMTAFWGALIVIPVFVLARDLWGRTAGLWAGFFAAISAPYIQRSIWGYADHDGFTMVFITLAMLFMVKAFRAAKAREYVADWRDTQAIWAGKKAAFQENRRAFLFATLAGLALSACALAWKGYPYALAILAVAAGLQFIADHLRNRDATATFLLYLTPLLIVVVLPWLLYYRLFPEFLDGTILPSLYVLLGVLVAGIVLVPTRQLPSVLVFPVLLVAAALGLVLLLVVFPAAGYQVFSGLGYFSQSKLYTTIAEAQRAQLGFVAASFGFFTFVLGFWGFGKSVKGAWKGEPAFMLVASWAVVAFFMAFAASRFIMNAVPIFAVLIGAAMMALVARLGFSDAGRRWRATRGQGVATRGAKSLSWKTTLGALAVVALFVLPVWTGVDAATPSEYDQERGWNERFGAYGISFDLRDNGWLPTMEYLAQQDTDVPLEDRPAVIAWWDYGHWIVGIGKHPTVADPFQSHFELAGRFLASESEAEAQAWITMLLVHHDYFKGGYGFSDPVRADLERASPGLADDLTATLSPWRGHDAQYETLVQHVNGSAIFDLYDDLSATTGKHVGYLAADIRMYPFSASSPGIFYAPVYLANKNPDDFLSTRLSSGGTTLTVQQYGVDDDGNSYRLDPPRYVDQSGTEWEVYNGYAYRPGQTPLQGFSPESGISLFSGQEQLVPTQKFQNSMFTRAFGSFSSTVPPCSGLSHWRAVQQSVGNYYGIEDARATVLCEYYTGNEVSGTVVDQSGTPLAGVQVAYVDGFGASHGASTTGPDGKFTALAPPGDDLKLTVQSGNQVVYEVADSGAARSGVTITVAPGTLEGTVYENTDGATGFNATGDKPLQGATVTVAGKTATTQADGSYRVDGVPAGSHSLTVARSGYNNATSTVVVRSGNATDQDVAMTARSSTVTLRYLDGGNGVAAIPVKVSGGSLASERTVTTNAQGNATTSLPAGDYVARVDYTATIDGTEQTFRGEQAFTVGPDGNAVTVVIQRN